MEKPSGSKKGESILIFKKEQKKQTGIMEEQGLLEKNRDELLELKTDLNFSIKKLKNVSKDLPEKLKEIKTMDSSGEDEQNISQIIDGIRNRFTQYSKDLESPFKIAVVGSQGTGKSSIVNLLLGEELMPSSTKENESAVIRLAYPPENAMANKALFELTDQSTKLMTIKEANRLIDKAERAEENDSFIKEVKYVTYYLQNDTLKEIELINTPGMNVLTDDFYPKVRHLFSEADVILWVNSSEQILDKFNSWLIQKIHADNDKIVGLITFPDKLYKQDENTGVTDVVTQFMTNLENERLIRENGQIGLFVLNGKFAQIAHSHKSGLKFVYNIEELEEEEEKLRMIYNYLHHGFAYSDDEENNDILEKYNLYGTEKDEVYSLEMDFDLYEFFHYCLNQKLCVLDKNELSASYTTKGRELLGEVSQYNAFGRFSEEYLIPRSRESKLESVKGRLYRSLSTVENEDNSLSRLIQIKEALIKKKDKLNKEEQDRLANTQYIVNALKKKFDEDRKRNLPYATDNFADDLLEVILQKVDSEIGMTEFLKEIFNSLIPGFLKRDTETAISRKTSEIIEQSVGTVLPKHMEMLAEKSNNSIELILLQMQQDYISNKTVNTRSNPQHHQGIPVELEFSGIFDTIKKKIKPLLANIVKDLLQNIAKKDLRKGANSFLKKNVVKPIVILIRKLLRKEAQKAAAKKAAQTGTKAAGMGPLGWLMIIADVAMIGNDLRLMYKQMKAELKEALKEEHSFRNIFEEQANTSLNFLIEAVVEDLNSSFAAEKTNVSFILDGINASDKVIKELEKFSAK
jgi:GTPase SAR1 family protein